MHDYCIKTQIMSKLFTSHFPIDNGGMSCHIYVEMYNLPDLNVQIRVILSKYLSLTMLGRYFAPTDNALHCLS